MATITKESIVHDVMKVVELTKSESTTLVNSVIKSIGDAVTSGNRVEIRGFGVFECVDRKPKIGYNFRTGEGVQIPAKKTVKFKVSKSLDRTLN